MSIRAEIARGADGKTITRFGSGSNQNIIDVIHADTPAAVKYMATRGARFRGATDEDTARNIWDFLRREIRYKADGMAEQNIKSPARLMADGEGDCKSYSLFTGAALSANGIPWKYRYASYRQDPTPSHVYVVAKIGGEWTPIDAVWKGGFGTEKPFKHNYDFMRIQSLTGTGAPVDNDPFFLGIGKAGKGKAKVKAKVQKVKAGVKKVAAKTAQTYKKTVGMAPRTAFLQLVKLNVRNLATHLAAVNQSKLAKKWQALGGSWGELNASIQKGKTRKPIIGIDTPVQYADHITGIGIAVETVAATLAIATPIIAALAAFIEEGKKLNAAVKGKDPEKEDDVKKAAEEAASQSGGSGSEFSQGPAPTYTKGENFDENQNTGAGPAPTESTGKNTGLLLGLGLVAAFLIFK